MLGYVVGSQVILTDALASRLCFLTTEARPDMPITVASRYTRRVVWQGWLGLSPRHGYLGS